MPGSADAPLIEVFVSIQGEGAWIGRTMVFVRTAVCPLRCTYCDTVESYEAPKRAVIRDFRDRIVGHLDNPVTAEVVDDSLAPELLDGVAHVSLTGGEPLLYPEFARELFARLKARGLMTHLETAALSGTALATVAPELDHLSMDWKLPGTIGRDVGDQHVACLEVGAGASCEITVKVVLTAGFDEDELADALDRLARFRGRTLVVLQPVTPCLRETEPLARERLLAACDEARIRGLRYCVLPQMHKHLGVR